MVSTAEVESSRIKIFGFFRTTRTVELTQAGLLFLDDARAMLEISRRAKKRAESAAEDVREPFVIGCHAHNDVLHLASALGRMRERFPQVYPIFQVVPFQHLYQRLSEEAVDVVMAFREGGMKKSIRYRELAKIPAVAAVEAGHPLARAGELRLRDLREVPVVGLNPQKCPEGCRELMHRILEDRSPLEVSFCESAEASVTLARAGYGAAVVPDFFPRRDPSLVYLPIVDAAPMSYGVYYKTLANHPRRRAFVELVRETFADALLPLLP